MEEVVEVGNNGWQGKAKKAAIYTQIGATIAGAGQYPPNRSQPLKPYGDFAANSERRRIQRETRRPRGYTISDAVMGKKPPKRGLFG